MKFKNKVLILKDMAQSVWKPRKHRVDNKEWSQESVIMSALRLKINKLTEQNFETFSKDIFQYEIDSNKTMQGLVEMLFDNMVLDVTFRSLYGRLFTGLLNKKVKSYEQSSATFKDEFMNKCDEEFRKHLNSEPCGDEFQEKYIRGTVKMLGLLYNEGIFSSSSIKCGLSLLLAAAQSNIKSLALENACHLLLSVGSKFLPQIDEVLKLDYLNQLTQLVDSAKIHHGMRLHFILQDTINFIKSPPQVPNKVKIPVPTKISSSKKVITVKRNTQKKTNGYFN